MYFSLNIIRAIKSKGIGEAGHIGRMEEMTLDTEFTLENLKRRELERHRRRFQGYIWILKTEDMSVGCGQKSPGSAYGTAMGSCKHGKELNERVE